MFICIFALMSIYMLTWMRMCTCICISNIWIYVRPGLHKDPDVHNIIVFDIGGGTLDVSLLYVADGSVQVRARVCGSMRWR